VSAELQQIEAEGSDRTEYQFATDEEAQLIAQGDLIAITYSHDPKLNGRFRVSHDGHLNLPYAIKEYVVGLNFLQLSKLIRSRYVNLYKDVEEISINLVERKRWVQVIGDISTTGNQLIDLKGDITQILAQKEISTEERKKLKYLKIKWKNTTQIFDLKKYFNNEIPWEQRKWHGGEILSFQSNVAPDDSEFPMVRVMGDVNDPGSFELDPEKDFYSYVLKAGGLRASANIENVYLIRGGQFKRKTYEYKLDDLVALGKPQANDTIVLFQDRATTTERRLQMAASIASILSAITILGLVF
jgi:protein involved in polysaccharide export with SLBB domain